MKRSVIAAIGAILLPCVPWTPIAKAASEAAKMAAVQKGLSYLYNTQQAGGYWNSAGDEQAATAAATFAFLSQRDQWGTNAIQYERAISKAIAFLLSTANTINVTTRNDGVLICPGTASCKGVYWFGDARSAHTTGYVAAAIAAYGANAGTSAVATTTGPLAGMTWGQIAQGITNTLASSQSTRVNGDREGGWGRYIPGNGDADSASTLSAITSFLYNETLGAETPGAVRKDLEKWLAAVQNVSGVVCQQPGVEPCNQAATGGWLLARKFAGYDLTGSRVQAALAYLNASWRSVAGNGTEGHFGSAYAMWALYQGLGATISLHDTTYILNRLTDCGARGGAAPDGSGRISCTWSEDYNQWLIEHQGVNGSWGSNPHWTDPLGASLAINILGATEIPLMEKEPLQSRKIDGQKETQQVQPTTASGTRAESSLALPASASLQATQSGAQAIRIRPRRRRGAAALAIDGSGDAIASASNDDRIRVFSTTTGQQRQILAGSSGLPTGLSFSRDSATIRGVGRDSLVRVWNAVSGAELTRLNGHEHAILAIAASRDDTLLATAGEDTRILLWNQTTRKLSKILFGPTDFVNALAFNGDGRLLAAATENARILLFEVSTGRAIFTLRGHSGPIDTAVFSPDGGVLATGGQDTVIHLWDPVRGQQLRALKGHSAPIRTIVFSPDGRLIASGGEDTQIRLWNAATGAMTRVLTGSSDFINVLVFDPRGNFLVSGNDAGEITFWSVISGTRLLTFRLP